MGHCLSPREKPHLRVPAWNMESSGLQDKQLALQDQFCGGKVCDFRQHAPADAWGLPLMLRGLFSCPVKGRGRRGSAPGAEAPRSLLSSPEAPAERLHHLAEPQVVCSTGYGLLQSSMNVRLVELDLLPLLPEVNPAGNDATDKPGQKYQSGFQHLIRPQKHSQPAPAGGEQLRQRHQQIPQRDPQP